MDICFQCSKELSHGNNSLECLNTFFSVERKQLKPRFWMLKRTLSS